jgi:hypothetical protein
MISQHNLRFVTKVLVAAISLAGICAAYLYITDHSEDTQKGFQTVAIDDMPTASINHFPEERLALEAFASGKAKHNGARKIQSRDAEKAAPTKKVVLKRSETTQLKISALPMKKISKGIEANIKKPIIRKVAPEQIAKKPPVKKDPIASLLMKN